MSKKEFKFEDYIGHYAMHCPEKWQAEVFFDKMIKEKSDLWERFGLKIPVFNECNEWNRFNKELCYGFNDCTVGRKRNFIDYKVLEFDDFDWIEEDFFKSAVDLLSILIALSICETPKKELYEDGFCPKCGSKTKMLKLGDKYFMVCSHCNNSFCVLED